MRPAPRKASLARNPGGVRQLRDGIRRQEFRISRRVVGGRIGAQYGDAIGRADFNAKGLGLARITPWSSNRRILRICADSMLCPSPLARVSMTLAPFGGWMAFASTILVSPSVSNIAAIYNPLQAIQAHTPLGGAGAEDGRGGGVERLGLLVYTGIASNVSIAALSATTIFSLNAQPSSCGIRTS